MAFVATADRLKWCQQIEIIEIFGDFGDFWPRLEFSRSDQTPQVSHVGCSYCIYILYKCSSCCTWPCVSRFAHHITIVQNLSIFILFLTKGHRHTSTSEEVRFEESKLRHNALALEIEALLICCSHRESLSRKDALFHHGLD